MTVDSSWEVAPVPIILTAADTPAVKRTGGGGRKARPTGVARVETEIRDGVEFRKEVLHPESFPATRRGRGKVAAYAAPKPKWVVGRGSGSGLWTGSQGDITLLNCVRRDTRAATKWALKHGSLVDAPWQVIGKRALFSAVRAARTFEEESCPPWEVAHVLEDLDEDLARIMDEIAEAGS
jgi:hypothetical protein